MHLVTVTLYHSQTHWEVWRESITSAENRAKALAEEHGCMRSKDRDGNHTVSVRYEQCGPTAYRLKAEYMPKGS